MAHKYQQSLKILNIKRMRIENTNEPDKMNEKHIYICVSTQHGTKCLKRANWAKIVLYQGDKRRLENSNYKSLINIKRKSLK